MFNLIGTILMIYCAYIIYQFYYGSRLCFIDGHQADTLKTFHTMHDNYFLVEGTKITYERMQKGMQLTWNGSFFEEELMDLIYEYNKKYNY